MKTKYKKFQSRQNTFWCLVCAVLVGAFAYGYLVNDMVHNVANRQKMEKEISTMQSKLSELEFKYIAMKNDISPEYAYSLGFKDVKKQVFITSNGISAGLSMKTQE
ncbi:MAG: hypothetical protein ABI430_02740 [Candidatus Taylorbacteria bacterium]